MLKLTIQDADDECEHPVFCAMLRNLDRVDPNDIAVCALKTLVPKPARRKRSDAGVKRQTTEAR